MMAFQVGLKCRPGVRFMPTRSAATSKHECASKPIAAKSKAVLCPHTTPRMTKLAAEAAKVQKSSGFLSGRSSSSKKCPKFCSYMDRQCPPLVPPIVKPKVVDTTGKVLEKPTVIPRRPSSDVPFAAVMAYRLAVFGAKLGVAGYCIKWTMDHGIWGNSRETSEMWERWSHGLQHTFPQLNMLNSSDTNTRSFAQYWNSAVIFSFDAIVETSRWLKRKAVEKERQVYGLPPLSSNNEEEPAGVTKTLMSSFGHLANNVWFGHNEDEMIGKPNPGAVLPDSPEYYGTKPDSAITEPEKEGLEGTVEEEVKGKGDGQEEVIGNLEGKEVPQFQVAMIIVKPCIPLKPVPEQDSEATVQKEQDNLPVLENEPVITKADDESSQVQIVDENSQTQFVSEDQGTAVEAESKPAEEARENDDVKMGRCCCYLKRSDGAIKHEYQPCTRPDCPMYGKLSTEQNPESNTN